MRNEARHPGAGNPLRARGGILRRVLFALVAGLVLILGFIGWSLQTDSGRTWVTGRGLALAQTFVPGLRISTSKLESPLLGHWRFGQLDVYYREKPLLSARQLNLKLATSALMSRMVHLQQLGAEYLFLDLDALPQADSPAEPGSLDFSLAQLPSVKLEDVHVDTLELHSGALPDFPEVELIAAAELAWRDTWADLQLKVRSLEEKPFELELEASAERPDVMEIKLGLQEPGGGYIGRRAQLPDTQALDTRLAAQVQLPESSRMGVVVHRLSSPLQKHFLVVSGPMQLELQPLKIHSEGLDWQVDDTRHFFRGAIDAEGIDGQLEINRMPVDVSAPFQEVLRGGWLTAKLKAEGPWKQVQLDGELELQTLLRGEDLSVQGRISADRTNLVLESAEIKLRDMQARGKGTFALGSGEILLDLDAFNVNLEAIAALTAPMPQDLALTADRLVLKASGHWKDPQFSVSGGGGGRYRELPFDFTADGEGNLDRFELSASLDSSAGISMNAQGALRIRDKSLRIQSEDINAQLSALGLLVDSVPQDFSGEVRGQASLEGPFDRLAIASGLEGSGTYRGLDMQFQANVEGFTDDLQVPALAIALNRPGEARGSAGELRASGNISPARGTLYFDLDGRQVPLSLAELFGMALPEGLAGTVDVTGVARGALSAPEADFAVAGAGRYRGEAWELRGEGQVRGADIQLPALTLQFGLLNRLDATGGIRAGEMDWRVDTELDADSIAELIPLSLPPGAKVRLKATGSGPLAQPSLQGELQLSALSRGINADGELLDNIPASFDLAWRTEASQLLWNGTVTSAGRQIGSLSGDLDIQGVFDPGQARAQLPLRGSINGDLRLAGAGLLLDPDLHDLRGHTILGLELLGTWGLPQFRGGLSIENGFYEYEPLSMQLADIGVKMEFAPDYWRVVDASATDGQRGRLRLSGDVRRQEGNYYMGFDLALRKAKLLNTPLVESAISGNLRLSGTPQDALLGGQLELRPLEIQVAHLTSKSIPSIEVDELKSDAEASRKRPSPLQNVALNITVVLDQQAYVRGMGLDSELQGRLNVAGTLVKPEARGNVEIVRGKFDMLGKRFRLDEGLIRVENNVAGLFIKGVHEHSEGSITTEISGTTEDIKVAFSATPPAAEDEIFAQLLFGKSVSDISPLQAVRLVTTIRSLKQGGGSFFDPVSQTRDLLGLDTLDIQTGETAEGEQEFALGVGKYVTDRIYVEVQRTTDPVEPWQGTAEVDLKRNLNLEVKTHESNDSGSGSVELQWKKDY
ncbi:translocation/assembly module TamB domain-containing protein [Biformimicrobium ophioploci]|uniref:translocation/assembly module TamB domain-containing protein n=1 Tax=Biformimicrobium ophioploci TaxID=3036711 RepID=UPI002552EF55|nr:translocation/assembly module TamB domain-containing protein [Microbulbifer sp. NKW57]